MLLILKKCFRPDYLRGSLGYVRPKERPMILYGINLWLKPRLVSAALQSRKEGAAHFGFVRTDLICKAKRQ